MSIYLGKPEYSPIKDYSEIQGDMSVVNSTIVITEGRVLKIDTGYAFCLIAKEISDISKPETFNPDTPICFVAHTSAYTRWTKDNPKLPVEPTTLERTLTIWLESDGAIWLEKSFKGKLHLNGAQNILDTITSNKLWHILAEFEECESNLIKPESLKPGTRRSGGSSGQTEAQRLADRQAYIVSQIGDYGKEVTNLLELAFALDKLSTDIPDEYQILESWLTIILSK